MLDVSTVNVGVRSLKLRVTGTTLKLSYAAVERIYEDVVQADTWHDIAIQVRESGFIVCVVN